MVTAASDSPNTPPPLSAAPLVQVNPARLAPLSRCTSNATKPGTPPSRTNRSSWSRASGCPANDRPAAPPRTVPRVIYVRLGHQGSRLSAARWSEDQAVREMLGVGAFDEEDFYGALEYLAANQSRIQAALAPRLPSRSVFLYDVTSVHFEGQPAEVEVGASAMCCGAIRRAGLGSGPVGPTTGSRYRPKSGRATRWWNSGCLRMGEHQPESAGCRWSPSSSPAVLRLCPPTQRQPQRLGIPRPPTPHRANQRHPQRKPFC